MQFFQMRVFCPMYAENFCHKRFKGRQFFFQKAMMCLDNMVNELCSWHGNPIDDFVISLFPFIVCLVELSANRVFVEILFSKHVFKRFISATLEVDPTFFEQIARLSES